MKIRCPVQIKYASSGMTLIEVIVAIGLVAIIAVAFLSVYTYSAYAERRSGDRTKNVAKAETITENAIAKKPITADPSAKTVTIGGEVFANAEYVQSPATVVITFNGNASNTATLNVTKSVVGMETGTANGGTVKSSIEVYSK